MPLMTVRGAALFYDLTGPEEAPVVAFSNSLGTTLEMWDAQVRALAGRYRCLRYDTRGHGRSVVTDAPFSIADLADDLADLLDGLRIDRVHLVGLSLGGMTAQSFAARHPGRLESLMLVATSAFLPTKEMWAERAATVRAHGMGSIVEAVMARWFTPDTVAVQPDVVSPVRDRFLQIDPQGYAAACEAIANMDLRGEISAIRAPTLVVAGEDDPATPLEMSEEIASLIPGAELIVIPEAAHLIAVEQPDAMSAALQSFIERIGGERVAAAGGVSLPAGLATRKSMLGVEHVQRSLERAGEFGRPWQEFISRFAWGEIWGDPTLPWKTRSLVTLSIMIALHREEEFKLHVRPAIRNGVTPEELRALLMHASIYAGVPATNAAFRWVREVLGEDFA
jgi:3-oxoadipate enol-lactonase / 4-carboxymuconolactone decarboxylase